MPGWWAPVSYGCWCGSGCTLNFVGVQHPHSPLSVPGCPSYRALQRRLGTPCPRVVAPSATTATVPPEPAAGGQCTAGRGEQAALGADPADRGWHGPAAAAL